MRVTLCVLNSKYIHSSLSVWCILAGIRTYCEKDIAAAVVEGTINEEIKNVAKRIIDTSPDVVGLSCYIWNIAKTYTLIALIKSALPYTKIIVGGPEVSYNAKEVLQNHPEIDYVVSGEGEKPFSLLLNTIKQDSNVKIDGVFYTEHGTVITSEPFVDTETPPSPYGTEYLEAVKGRIAYIETCRGCPYSCTFCLSGRCGKARFFDLEQAKRNILLLASSGTQTIKFVDRTFNANRERARALWQFIIDEQGHGIPSGVCCHFEIAGDLIDEKTLEILKSAPIGAIQLEIGLQSFNEKTLAAIHRKTNTAHLCENIKKLVALRNMHIHIDLIAGLPYEDIESFEKSFDSAYALHANMLQLGFLKLLYGSAMRENKDEFPCEYSDEPPYEVTCTPWLDEDDLASLRRTEDAVDHISNSGKFKRTLELLLQGTTPYRFFKYVGEHSQGDHSVTHYEQVLYSLFKSDSLRDALVLDRLATDSGGCIPDFLKVYDGRLKAFKASLEKPEKGIKRRAVLMKSENIGVYADYDMKNPITGEYELHFVKL